MADEAAAGAAVLQPLDMLPWHEPARARMHAAATGARFPHAILVHGPAGTGKERFAAALGATLLCTGRGERFEACGQCANCMLCAAGTHPDLHWLRPPEDKRSIGVDQVRDACEKLAMTSMRGGYRVAIVQPAQAMTQSAQNALLKTLEEPAPHTLLMLVTSRPSSLLATLRSRCQRLEIACPSASVARAWLKKETGAAAPDGLLAIAGGAPLRALEVAPHFEALDRQMTELFEDLLAGRIDACAAAAGMLGEGLPTRLDWLESWLSLAIRDRAVPTGTRLTVPGGPVLQRTAGEVNISAAFRLLDRVREVRRLLEGSAAAQLLVEALLVEAAGLPGRRGISRWL